MRRHAGQIACPGGRFDARTDHTLWDTAARETAEEVGVAVSRDALLGYLDPVHIRVSGFTLLPAVAGVDRAPAVVMCPEEVADYEWITLQELQHCRQNGRADADDVMDRMPEFPLRWGRLWGATARVVGQLLDSLDALEGGI